MKYYKRSNNSSLEITKNQYNEFKNDVKKKFNTNDINKLNKGDQFVIENILFIIQDEYGIVLEDAFYNTNYNTKQVKLCIIWLLNHHYINRVDERQYYYGLPDNKPIKYEYFDNEKQLFYKVRWHYYLAAKGKELIKYFEDK